MFAKRPDWEKHLRHFPLNPQGVPAKLKQRVEERIAMGETPKRYRGGAWVAGAVLLLAAAILVAEREPILSLFKPDKDGLPFDTVTERSVKVNWVDGMSFMMRYGEAFIIKYPHMDVETVNSPPYDPQKDRTAQFEEMIERDKPDLVYLPTDVYRNLAGKGLLLPLESMIAKDKFKLADFHEGVVEALKSAGGGGLYGLSPDFRSAALYFNKSLFDKHGVAYPTDRMSWEEVFRLAQRFPVEGQGDERVYGLSTSSASAYGAAETAGWTMGLRLTSADGSQMTAHTEAWKPIWQFVVDGVRKGWLYEAQPRTGSISGIDFYKRYPFLTGNAAMFVADSSIAFDLVEAKRRYQLAEFAWDVVTEPVDPARPGVSSSFSMDYVYAIPAQSANSRDAWEMLKFIVSPAIAKKVAAQYSGGFGLSSRQDVPLSLDGYRMEAFSALKPDPDYLDRMDRYSLLPRETSAALNAVINEEIKAAAAGSKTIDDAIQAIRQRGQQLLDAAKAAGNP